MIVSRRRGVGRYRGLGYVSPVGFADFASFQTAAIASYPACPPPFDPTCENPRDAQIAANLEEWKTNPQSCGVIVCGGSGQPVINYQPYTAPNGQAAVALGTNSNTGFVPTSPVNPPPPPMTETQKNILVLQTLLAGCPLQPDPQSCTMNYTNLLAVAGGKPTPIQSNSAANAPGGSNASPASPTPIQTQTPPLSSSACSSSQTYIPPGGTFASGPMAGQVTSTGACQDNAPSIGDFISQIPAWGWGVALIGALVIFRGGKR